MRTHNLGYPRIGSQRELKKACENFWAGRITAKDLMDIGLKIRKQNWKTQQEAGIDLIPVNDFSLYDQVLDMTVTLGVIPERYQKFNDSLTPLERYFAMARGLQNEKVDVTAMEMTKWFDTNYHYLVPEFSKSQTFQLDSRKVVGEFLEAKQLGIQAKPVLIGPVSYLLLGKEKKSGFHRLSLLPALLPVYVDLLKELKANGAEYIQFDEPFLALDLTPLEQELLHSCYEAFRKEIPELKLILANYFDCYGDNLDTALKLPVDVLHLDLVRCPSQLDDILTHPGLSNTTVLSLGLVDGRNIWKNNLQDSLDTLKKGIGQLGTERIWIAPSCSLLHVPCDLDLEIKLNSEIKDWLAFARQKLDEVAMLKELLSPVAPLSANDYLETNQSSIKNRSISSLIHNPKVRDRIQSIQESDYQRKAPFPIRQKAQRDKLRLPLFPTTTIGSFPQTKDIRQLRSQLKSGKISPETYDEKIKAATVDAIRWQEEIGLDVLVHGEFERNDMVEYFGELLEGFAFSQAGWVQSYGSRCVKPPILYGDIWRSQDLSVGWTTYAQQHTDKPMKGMLTGPVTILQWSFVRDDQPRSLTTRQIALAIRDEVEALEAAGIAIIQIDEPALREGLPLRKKDWATYLDWAVGAFRLSCSGVKDETQIHTHMCYSEFNDIIQSIADMDADVITIETSRSEMELLDAFVNFKYPYEIGPGVYDIHSPRVPQVREMVHLLQKAATVIPHEHLWVNPDCGLKTRGWYETREALKNMVEAAKQMRQSVR
jgi:5-methyltetrahydropteroyltriglutamate--homocysteine methyltransferase